MTECSHFPGEYKADADFGTIERRKVCDTIQTLSRRTQNKLDSGKRIKNKECMITKFGNLPEDKKRR